MKNIYCVVFFNLVVNKHFLKVHSKAQGGVWPIFSYQTFGN
jgi:hypothetical protein